MVRIGAKLGLYKVLHNAGPVTVEQFAKRTGIAERYGREWLANQVRWPLRRPFPFRGIWEIGGARPDRQDSAVQAGGPTRIHHAVSRRRGKSIQARCYRGSHLGRVAWRVEGLPWHEVAKKLGRAEARRPDAIWKGSGITIGFQEDPHGQGTARRLA